MSVTIDDTICPFCKAKNKCMARADEPCWCNTINVPKELRALAPKETSGKVCICRKCIQLFKENPTEFLKRSKICL